MGTRRLCIPKYDGKRYLRPKDTLKTFLFTFFDIKKNGACKNLVRSLCCVGIYFLVFGELL